MYAVEFEADLQGNVLRIPDRFKEIANKHVRVAVMTDDTQMGSARKPGTAKGQVRSMPGFEDPLSVEEFVNAKEEKSSCLPPSPYNGANHVR